MVKRQDLHSSIPVATPLKFTHTTFAELQWTRDPFSPTFSRLPPGFQDLASLLAPEFIEIVEDVDALRRIRDVLRFTKGDVMQMAHINNHTASIQSRLMELKDLSPILDFCRLGVYLCSVMLCCNVWCALIIPVCSSFPYQLSRCVEQHRY